MEQIITNILYYNESTHWVVHFLLMVLVSMIPFAPIPVLATFIGTNYSFTQGVVINISGTLIGSTVLFILSKYVLRNFATTYAVRFSHLQQFFQLIQHNAFLAVLIGRIVPIVPSAGINIIAGISNVSFIAFVTATFLGKLPTIIAFSLAGHQMADGNWDTVLLIFIYIIILFLITKVIKKNWLHKSV